VVLVGFTLQVKYHDGSTWNIENDDFAADVVGHSHFRNFADVRLAPTFFSFSSPPSTASSSHCRRRSPDTPLHFHLHHLLLLLLHPFSPFLPLSLFLLLPFVCSVSPGSLRCYERRSQA